MVLLCTISLARLDDGDNKNKNPTTSHLQDDLAIIQCTCAILDLYCIYYLSVIKWDFSSRGLFFLNIWMLVPLGIFFNRCNWSIHHQSRHKRALSANLATEIKENRLLPRMTSKCIVFKSEWLTGFVSLLVCLVACLSIKKKKTTTMKPFALIFNLKICGSYQVISHSSSLAAAWTVLVLTFQKTGVTSRTQADFSSAGAWHLSFPAVAVRKERLGLEKYILNCHMKLPILLLVNDVSNSVKGVIL